MRSLALGCLLPLCAGCAATHAAWREPASPIPRAPRVEASVELPAADGGQPITFAEALRAANDDAPAVLQAEARLRRAAAQADAEMGALLPRVRAGGGVRGISGREIGNFANQMDGIEYARFELGVSLFYDINVGERVASADAAYDEHGTAAHELHDARLRAQLSIGRAYFDLLLAQAAIGIVDQLASDAERLVALTRARLETEVGNAADVARAEAELSRARAARSRAAAARVRASATLAALLGREPEPLLIPAEAELPLLDLVDASLSTASDRPDVAAARARADAASARAAARWWAAFGPELSAGVQPALIGIDLGDLGGTLNTWAWLGVTVGLDDIGAARAADAEAELRALERDELEVRARAEVVAAAAELLAARDAVLAAREAAAALERAHRLHVARYEEGVGTAFDVLEAQRALAAARVELAETILRYDGAQLELLVAAGRAPDARVGRGQ